MNLKKLTLILCMAGLLLTGNLLAKNTTAVIKTNLGDIELELTDTTTPKTVDNFIKLAKKDYYNGIYFHRVIPDFMIQGGDPNTKNDNRGDDGSGGPGYKFEDECYIKEGTKKLTGEITDQTAAIRVYQEVLMPYMQKKRDKADPEILKIMTDIRTQRAIDPVYAHNYEYYYEKTASEPLYTQGKLIASVDYGTLCMANSGPNTNGSQFFIVTKKEGASWLNGKHTVFGKVTKGMDVVHTIEGLKRDAKDNPLAENQAIIKSIEIK